MKIHVNIFKHLFKTKIIISKINLYYWYENIIKRLIKKN